MRMAGMASGMDIQEIVNNLMMAERMPMNKMLREQQTINWKMESYREINTKFNTFRNNIFDNVMRASTMLAKTVTSSNSNLVTATGNSTVGNTTMRLSEVKQLASAASTASTGSIGGADFDPGKPIGEQPGFEDFNEDDELTITTYGPNGEPVPTEFKFSKDQSLNQILQQINSSNAGVTAFYDDVSKKVSFSRTETGRFNPDNVDPMPDESDPDNGEPGGSNPVVRGKEIEFAGDFFLKSLKLEDAMESGGQNAKFTINGLTTERPTNTFTISGMTITLKETFDNEVTLSPSTNTDEVFDTIKAFVDEYNELLAHVNGVLTEDRNRNYQPLTDEEREALSEREAEKWEDLARQGLLKNDPILRNQMDRLRSDLYTPIETGMDTVFKHLSAIGITTSADYMERGKLEINEDKLRAAIEEDAEGVFNLFAADGDTFAEKGLARRLRDTLDTAITQVAERAGGLRGKVANHQFTLGKNLEDLNTRIANFERRLEQREQRYWSQFTAMEKAIHQMNSQSDFIYAQLFNQG
ncbi:flagellar cap protein FliD [Alkalihalobacillus alcalophilus ATCC 27647 = CGMCC 1.3604]|uniref:Flagellar hook-associated protein 2 n=1 Tax=Alkalihalobacillus alcalophilus ATCC 27647 = CGMCC 1.3604 TaxID=1218173 RepID=A0A4V3X806_ALKAL|nr:flagellar cap protein FliD [Alkalihalobacillus alcalophilus ATCC 27647 = CGMCC 1.3604]